MSKDFVGSAFILAVKMLFKGKYKMECGLLSILSSNSLKIGNKVSIT